MEKQSLVAYDFMCFLQSERHALGFPASSERKADFQGVNTQRILSMGCSGLSCLGSEVILALALWERGCSVWMGRCF